MSTTQLPRARRGGIRIEAHPEVPVAIDETTDESFYLRPEWLATYERCDGRRDVAAIAAELHAAGVDVDVWQCLDALADLGLLEERVAPPAGSSLVTRRNLLRASAVAGAAAAAALVAVRPAAANQNTEEQEKAHEQRTKNEQESRDKHQEAQLKRDEARYERKDKEQTSKEQRRK